MPGRSGMIDQKAWDVIIARQKSQ